MGDNRETRCYEALGRLQGLTAATIHLDCSNMPTDPGRLGVGATTNQLERALINSAVDETLARSIWEIVSADSARSRLKSLHLISSGGSSFGNSHPGDLMTIVNHISRSYKIRHSRDDEHEALSIVESTKIQREERDQRQREHEQVMIEKWGSRGLRGAFDVMNQLWGLEEGYGNWREAWKSFPLQRSTQTNG